MDDFWSSVLDFVVDVQFLPVPDPAGHLVHAGFNAALGEVGRTSSATPGGAASSAATAVGDGAQPWCRTATLAASRS